MPVIIPGSNATASPTIQQLINEMRAYPEFIPVIGPSGYTQYPMLTIANDVMQRILAEGMDWKWNRAYVPGILTVALQQDYVTQIVDIGWLETAWMLDINNSTNNGNLAPKPVRQLEAVRDIPQTSIQNVPFNISFIPNRLAFLGQWQAHTKYGTGYGVAQIPITPIQQFMDVNGNILYIDSTVLNLSINSPGFNGITPIVLPSNSPYGTSGSTQPAAYPQATPGTTVQDGTVIWTVADPDGIAIRVSPLPAFSGLAWLISPVYQIIPPTFNTIQQTIDPIPPEFAYLFRQGVRAKLYEHAGSNKAESAYAKWEEALIVAIRSGDRQAEDNCMYPTKGIMTQNGYLGAMGAGASWPFGPGPFFGN